MTINTRAIYDKYVEQDGKLSYNAFKEVLFAYNKAMVLECIVTGGEWLFRGKVGELKIIQCKRRFTVQDNGNIRGAIDWGESNKLKKKLISEGKLPLEMYKDENNKIIGNNGGVAWMCYFTSDSFFKWSFTPHLYLKHGFKYFLDMSWTNSKILSQSINENSSIIYKFVAKS